jgi:hypothetical protein
MAPKYDVGSRVSGTAISLDLIYGFPYWFLRGNFHIIAATSYFSEPTLGLTVYRRIELDEDNGIFQRMQSGDTAALKSGLDRRLISPHDLRAETGEPALMYALKIGHRKREDMIKILLSAGASPFQERKRPWHFGDPLSSKTYFRTSRRCFIPRAASRMLP